MLSAGPKEKYFKIHYEIIEASEIKESIVGRDVNGIEKTFQPGDMIIIDNKSGRYEFIAKEKFKKQYNKITEAELPVPNFLPPIESINE